MCVSSGWVHGPERCADISFAWSGDPAGELTETRPDQCADAHLTPVRSWVGADISLACRRCGNRRFVSRAGQASRKPSKDGNGAVGRLLAGRGGPSGLPKPSHDGIWRGWQHSRQRNPTQVGKRRFLGPWRVRDAEADSGRETTQSPALPAAEPDPGRKQSVSTPARSPKPTRGAVSESNWLKFQQQNLRCATLGGREAAPNRPRSTISSAILG